jgi:hypothetical protein
MSRAEAMTMCGSNKRKISEHVKNFKCTEKRISEFKLSGI